MAAASNAPVLLITLIAAAIAGGALADGGSSPSVEPSHTSVPFNRSSFPAGFLFGAGSAAYQLEGAASKDGRGPSIWDTFTKNHPEKIWDHSSGEVATDFYHRYKEDVQIMKKMGLDSFRFSISWSRILPKGTVRGGVNPLGVKFYNNLINELLANVEMDFRFLHPITYGTYPKSMRQYVGDRLPKFSAAESKSVKGSMDFLGMNYYTGNFADNVPFSNSPNKSYSSDAHVAFSTERDGVLIGPAVRMAYSDNMTLPIKEALKDGTRIKYHHAHLASLLQAIKYE
ncbi:hypothetical protein SDJN02_12173, partial [Cucurbita argyrosperma subsp. argyrosperma]